jgi:peptide/nickel transport system ATP-binding protein
VTPLPKSTLLPEPTPLPEPLVRVTDLKTHFPIRRGLVRRQVGAVRAVDGVSFTIPRGRTLGLVGESGCGKTTVARSILRLVEPTSGHVSIGGEDVRGLRGGALRKLRRRMQIVFQDPYRSLNPRRTVGDSIIEGPMNYGATRQEAWKHASELMELVRLEPTMLQRFPHEFSGGQRQRICIARSLAMKPEILIADEAVSALDVSVQAQVLGLLDEVREQLNLAMLFITHDLRVAAQVCDRVAVMSKGEIVETGRTADIFLAPAHAYTQTLFAAAPGRDWLFEAGRARLKKKGDSYQAESVSPKR